MIPTTTTRACGSSGASSQDCATQLRGLYDAYMKIISGTNTVSVQSADFRRIQYGPGNLKELISQYNALWDSCDGASTGLSKLGTQRGGPAYLG
jgi:hypothetical protein